MTPWSVAAGRTRFRAATASTASSAALAPTQADYSDSSFLFVRYDPEALGVSGAMIASEQEGEDTLVGV